MAHSGAYPDFAGAETACTEERLEGLVNGIIDLLERDGADTSLLRPPALRVSLSTRHLWRVNAFFVRGKTGDEIVLGRGLCVFLHYYTRAAATYFLPSSEGGERPSELWPDARAAMATTLEWLSSPSSAPRFVDFRITPHQARIARIFGDYAFRFALCHEIGHSIAKHHPAPNAEAGPDNGDQVLAWKRDQEIEADRLGLQIQLAALHDETQLTNGIASAAYATHAAELLRLRLMLVAELVDFTRWQTRLTHPPLLFRFAMLMKTAEQIARGGGAGLHSLHDQLAGLNSEITGEVSELGDQVAASTRHLLDEQVRTRLASLGDESSSTEDLEAGLELRSTDPPPVITKRLLDQFDRSPLGVLRGLDPPAARRTDLGPRGETVRALLARRVVSELPPEFERFMRLSAEGRTDAILRIPARSRDI